MNQTVKPARAVSISVSSARKDYGDVVALDDVSIDVPAGSLLALVGESGSGKTTLLRCCNGLTALDAGTVELGGKDITHEPSAALRRSIGYVQQDGGLLPHWTVLQNASLVPRLIGRDSPEEAGSARLVQVGLDPASLGSRWPSELSGGQRQRVALARALAGDPPLLLLDEPFGALDAITRYDVHETFTRVRAETGITAVLVTHDLREAVSLADTIAVMKHGRILQQGTPRELLENPEPGYVKTLFARAGVSWAGVTPEVSPRASQ